MAEREKVMATYFGNNYRKDPTRDEEDGAVMETNPKPKKPIKPLCAAEPIP